MPREITFPRIGPVWLESTDSVLFLATEDGQPIRCIITAAALHEKYGIPPMHEECFEAFHAHKETIHTLARNKILKNDFSSRGEILISSIETIPRRSLIMGSSYGPEIQNSEQWRSLIDTADSSLAHIVLRSHAVVRAQWNLTLPPPNTVFQLELIDDKQKVSTYEWFSAAQLRDPDLLRKKLERVWGDYLQALSHHQLQAISGRAEE